MAEARGINYHKVVGEPFEPWVNQQIIDRQRIYASGFNSNRSAQQIHYLNGRDSWVKVGSGVNVARDPRLTRIGITNPSPYKDEHLAQSFVLFNTLNASGVARREASLNDIPRTHVDESFGIVNNRRGVTAYNSLINNSAYGFGGTKFGIQPPPGIVSFDVNHLNRGSIREATLEVVAYNPFQFNLIDLLYLRLGFSILVEFGHSHYLDGTNVEPMGKTILDGNSFFRNPGIISGGNGSHLSILQEIKNTQYNYLGSYDAIFGQVKNFTWKFSPDGTYRITIKIVSLGDVIESLKINTLPERNQFTPENTEGSSVTEEENDPKVNRDAITNWLYCLQKIRR